jgi:hypothetical protein
MKAGPLPRRLLVSHAPPAAFAPMTRAMLARLGYSILEPEDFEKLGDADQRPDLYVVDERSLGELPDDGGPPVPIVVLTGHHGVTGADPRIVGAICRPAGLHELYRLLQQVLEDTPRTTPRIPTHLWARCEQEGREWRATVVSISENGCLLRSPEPLLLGSKLTLHLALPRQGQLALPAEVAYQLIPDVGLVFSAARAHMRAAIAEFVSQSLVAA